MVLSVIFLIGSMDMIAFASEDISYAKDMYSVSSTIIKMNQIRAMLSPRSIITGKRHRMSFPRTEKGDESKWKDIFLPRWK